MYAWRISTRRALLWAALGGSSLALLAHCGSSAALRTIADYVGVNGFIDDPIAKLAPIGNVREYHDLVWIADNGAASPGYPQATYTFMNFNGAWLRRFAGNS